MSNPFKIQGKFSLWMNFSTFLKKGFSLLKPLDQKREKNKIYMHQLKLKHNITVSFVRNQSRKEKKTPAERLNWVQKQK